MIPDTALCDKGRWRETWAEREASFEKRAETYAKRLGEKMMPVMASPHLAVFEWEAIHTLISLSPGLSYGESKCRMEIPSRTNPASPSCGRT